mmetsp:Transcript_89982/g.160161  ORF Transcript_89982/g.160161 Transcript_89982/m.160161 type:complete len:565 (+) Transcript_89982:64-1758(+)
MASNSKKVCYYELLGLDRKCDAAEIKTSYRKLALRMHPDKAAQNNMSVEDATARFQKIQEAYQVLSDAQERAWYDAHREQILRGDDEPGEDPFKTKINLYKYFSTACFNGFGDNSTGFFAVYADLFAEIDAEEEQWEDADEDHVAMPPFGRSDTDWLDVAAFYRNWLEFCSRKAFGHADQWNPKDAQNRQVRRAMEQENKKARQAAKKEFNAEVRQLVKFVQKRDPRVATHQKQQMKENIEKTQRQKAEKDRQKVDTAKEKEKQKLAAREAEEERWAEAKALKEAQRARGEIVSEDEEDDSDDEETEVYYCEPCRKSFKSEKAFDQHAKSKKHLQVVAKLRKDLEMEMKAEEKRKKAEEARIGKKEEEYDDENEDDESEEEPHAQAANVKDVQNGKQSEESEDQDESDEDDFVARFAASRGRGGGRGGGRGYPAASASTPQAAEAEEDEEDTEDEDAEEDKDDTQDDGRREKRNQRREQQKAILIQKKQERENVQEMVNGARKGQKSKTSEEAPVMGSPPEGNTCGVCKEEFPSRSALFKHIKATGHAMLKPIEPETAKGRKKR